MAIQLFSGADNQDSAIAQPTVQVAEPTAIRTGNFVPFEGNGDGIFEILTSQWSDDGLHLRIRIEVDSGEHSFGMYAFVDETRELYDPSGLGPFTVQAGVPYVRDVTFEMPHADSTIVLATRLGDPLNALPVKR